MTHTQTIPNLIVIDKDWLLNEIKKVNQGLISSTEVLQYMFTNSYPLSPIVEDAWLQGKKNNVMWANDKEYEVLKQNYLSQPIKLEK